ncbi:MAG: hypothetical protein N4A72_19265 [Bacteroidales bacterium]|jgi:hypothetical protein|nr:hypothetical protein [Bacteroidales bacterium]
MKLTEVKKIVLKEALVEFKHMGYTKKKDYLIRNREKFSYYVGFAFVDNDNSFPTNFHYGISSKLLNNILLEIFPEKGYKQDEYIGVYGINQLLLYDKKKYPILEYDIKSEMDIKIMVKEMVTYFNEFVLPFLEQLSSYDTLNNFLNSKGVISESMHLPTTLINGIIFSRITKDEGYDKVKTRYRDLIESWSEWDKLDLIKVIEFLDNHSYEDLILIDNQ